MGSEKRKTVQNMPESNVTKYDTTTALIIDDVTRPDNTPGSAKSAAAMAHEKKCDLIHDLLANDFEEVDIKSVRLNANDGEEAWHNLIDEVLSARGPRDLVIIYFHGKSDGDGANYRWHFAGEPKMHVNAAKTFARIKHSDVDCLFLLDCYMPTRMTPKPNRALHITEFIQSGKNIPDSTLAIANADPKDHDFTEGFCHGLKHYAKSFPVSDKRKTVLEVLKDPKLFENNPLRSWVIRTEAGSEAIVRRLVIEPRTVRETSKIQLFACRIQGPADEDDVSSNESGSHDGGSDGSGPEDDASSEGDADDRENEDDEDDDEGDDADDGGDDDDDPANDIAEYGPSDAEAEERGSGEKNNASDSARLDIACSRLNQIKSFITGRQILGSVGKHFHAIEAGLKRLSESLSRQQAQGNYFDLADDDDDMADMMMSGVSAFDASGEQDDKMQEEDSFFV